MNDSKKLFCVSEKCCWCGSCKIICPTNSIVFKRTFFGNQVFIKNETCIHCGLCEKVCQFHNDIKLAEPLFWKEGWCTNQDIRKTSSSGGMAKTIALSCLKRGWKIFMCVASKASFYYKEVHEAEILNVSGSFYVKSSLGSVFKTVKEYLLSKEKVLFIGLPCHVSSLKQFLFNVPTDNFFTIDLICHGTPSLDLFKAFSEEAKINDYQNLSFRQKNKSSYKPLKFDYWIIPFLDGLTYTDNCYHCNFASKKRVSDLTLGDSWGSDLNNFEKNKGISLILINTDKGNELIPFDEVFLKDVNIEESIKAQGQLQSPSRFSIKRNLFIKKISSGHGYHKVIKKIYYKKIIVSYFRNIPFVYYVYRKIKPPSFSSYISFSLEKRET